jgi:hypothetical protein
MHPTWCHSISFRPCNPSGPTLNVEAGKKPSLSSLAPFDYEVTDLTVTTQGELAFVHSLNHVSGTLANGHITDLWVRWTAYFRRIDGVWLVVHDHGSVPADRTELLKP